MNRPDWIKHMPERRVVANVVTRLRMAKVECAIEDVKGIGDLPLTPAHVAVLARQAERALLDLMVSLKELPNDGH